MSHIYIAYGSETGNAENLARTLLQQLADHQIVAVLSTLNDLPLENLQEEDQLFIISSNFGDGEATGNATKFYDTLQNLSQLKVKFAIFGLGDVSYPKFCGFTKALDEKFRSLGATAIANRVDADTAYHSFFRKWGRAVLAYLQGNTETLQTLNLQVKAYGTNKTFPAIIQRVTPLNQGEYPVYDIEINIAGSGIHYNAGDLLYLVPPANPYTLARIDTFYGGLSSEEKHALSQKELRILTKSLFRALAKKTGDVRLKDLTKISASQAFNTYVYGRDIADVLMDFCRTHTLPFADLLDLLSEKLPRAYSIASSGQCTPDSIRLCVREVAYTLNGTAYCGTGSGFLCHSQVGDQVAIYVRANPNFHLPEDKTCPVIMIGAGTGIAPYLGFLSQSQGREMALFFGERHHITDFLYQDVLEKAIAEKRLTALYTAFSRDQEEKIYVQHLVYQQKVQVWQWLQQGGHIYVCGSKANLGRAIDDALSHIAMECGGLEESQCQQWLQDLTSQQRYHKDLY